MNLYEYQRSRSFVDLGPSSLRSNNFKSLFVRNRWAAMRIYGKKSPCLTKRPITLKLGLQYRLIDYYQIYSNDDTGMALTYFTAKSYLFPYDFVWEKDKNNIFVFNIKVGRCNPSNTYMKHYEYQRSGSFIDIIQGHSGSTFSNFFSLKTLKQVEAKFHVDRGMKVSATGLCHMTVTAAISIYGKNL